MVILRKKFSVGERVFAKVRGHVPWPAKIENIEINSYTNHIKYHVVFYGTNEVGICNTESLFSYAHNKDKFSKSTRKYFAEGIQALEKDLQEIPNPVSKSAENVSEEATVPGKEELDNLTFTAGEEKNSVIGEGREEKYLKRKLQDINIAPEISKVKRKRGALIISNNQIIKSVSFQNLLTCRVSIGNIINKGKKKVLNTDKVELENEILLRTLRTELQMTSLNEQLRLSTSLNDANADTCLEAIEQVSELHITKLMLKKHPEMVETIRRLRRYIGNLTQWTLSEEDTDIFKEKAKQIREKSIIIYDKFRSLLGIPENQNFWKCYIQLLEQFKLHTKDMTTEEVLSLLSDPTEGIKLISEEATATAISSANTTTSSITAEAVNKCLPENSDELGEILISSTNTSTSNITTEVVSGCPSEHDELSEILISSNNTTTSSTTEEAVNKCLPEKSDELGEILISSTNTSTSNITTEVVSGCPSEQYDGFGEINISSNNTTTSNITTEAVSGWRSEQYDELGEIYISSNNTTTSNITTEAVSGCRSEQYDGLGEINISIRNTAAEAMMRSPREKSDELAEWSTTKSVWEEKPNPEAEYNF